MLLAVIVGTVVAGWFAVRLSSRGKPYPVWMRGFLDNSIVDRLSGTATLIERAGVTEGMRVLDAGSGPGRLTIPLADRVGSGGEVVALDLQEGMLTRVRERAARLALTNVRTLRIALENLPASSELGSSAFDRAFLVTVIGEVPDPEAALIGLYRVLKAGGILSITEILIDPDYVPRQRITGLAQRAGFQLDASFGNVLMFTLNFRRPA